MILAKIGVVVALAVCGALSVVAITGSLDSISGRAADAAPGLAQVTAKACRERDGTIHTVIKWRNAELLVPPHVDFVQAQYYAGNWSAPLGYNQNVYQDQNGRIARVGPDNGRAVFVFSPSIVIPAPNNGTITKVIWSWTNTGGEITNLTKCRV